jgi:hypothetical protein
MKRLLRTTRSILVVPFSALVLSAGIAGAAEHGSLDVRRSHTITVVDSGLLSPGAVTIGHGESVEFANYSSEAIEVVFTEPKDHADEVRCQVTRDSDRNSGSGSTVRWPFFVNGPTNHPTMTIPPGRYATACSFSPGRYAFVTKRVSRDARSSVDGLGEKGTITVE